MSELELSGKMKKCKQCDVIFPIEWFAHNKLRVTSNSEIILYRCSICPMCAQTARDKRKHADRAIEKARRIIYSHGKRLAGKWGIRSGGDLIANFGWNITQLAHDINHAYNNSCSYCRRAYREMEHGLRDVTLDIVNPNQQPFYATNTKLCCATCNSIKGQRGASTFGLHLAMVQRWKEAKPGTIYSPQYTLGIKE